jgi:hypothetical protein
MTRASVCAGQKSIRLDVVRSKVKGFNQYLSDWNTLSCNVVRPKVIALCSFIFKSDCLFFFNKFHILNKMTLDQM